jgi:hypothetical protein
LFMEQKLCFSSHCISNLKGFFGEHNLEGLIGKKRNGSLINTTKKQLIWSIYLMSPKRQNFMF